MKILMAIAAGALLSLSAFGADNRRPEICFTSGECQDKHPLEYANICYKLNTGLDTNGNETCTPQCTTMAFAYTCEKFKELSYGTCKREATPSYDTNPSTCWGALDPDEAP